MSKVKYRLVYCRVESVNYYKSALSRQIGEAVRIGRRGGAGMVLNSKSEFNRCRIPRLVIEEVDEEQIREEEERELRVAMEHLSKCEEEWEQNRTKEREHELKGARRKLERIERTVQSRKRDQNEIEGAEVAKKRRKLKYRKEQEGWGEEQTTTAPTQQPLPTEGNVEEVGSSPRAALQLGSRADPECSRLLQTSIWKFVGRVPPKPAGTHCDTVEKTTPSEQYGAFAGSSNGGGEDTGTVGTNEDEERIREVKIHDEKSAIVK